MEERTRGGLTFPLKMLTDTLRLPPRSQITTASSSAAFPFFAAGFFFGPTLSSMMKRRAHAPPSLLASPPSSVQLPSRLLPDCHHMLPVILETAAAPPVRLPAVAPSASAAGAWCGAAANAPPGS